MAVLLFFFSNRLGGRTVNDDDHHTLDTEWHKNSTTEKKSAVKLIIAAKAGFAIFTLMSMETRWEGHHCRHLHVTKMLFDLLKCEFFLLH